MDLAEASADRAVRFGEVEPTDFTGQGTGVCGFALLGFYQPSIALESHVLDESPRAFSPLLLEEVDVGHDWRRVREVRPHVGDEVVVASDQREQPVTLNTGQRKHCAGWAGLEERSAANHPVAAERGDAYGPRERRAQILHCKPRVDAARLATPRSHEFAEPDYTEFRCRLPEE